MTADVVVELCAPGTDMVWHGNDVSHGEPVNRDAASPDLVLVIPVMLALAPCPTVGVAVARAVRVDLGAVGVDERDLGVIESRGNLGQGVRGELVVVVELDEGVAEAEGERHTLDVSDVATRWDVGLKVPDLVPLVSGEAVDLVFDGTGCRVVVDDPFPVFVGLCFEGGPGAGQHVRLGVVRRCYYRNHALCCASSTLRIACALVRSAISARTVALQRSA